LYMWYNVYQNHPFFIQEKNVYDFACWRGSFILLLSRRRWLVLFHWLSCLSMVKNYGFLFYLQLWSVTDCFHHLFHNGRVYLITLLFAQLYYSQSGLVEPNEHPLLTILRHQ
jgi:hypothetical protein